MGQTWGPPGSCRPHPGGPHVCPMNLAIRDTISTAFKVCTAAYIQKHTQKLCRDVSTDQKVSFVSDCPMTNMKQVACYVLDFVVFDHEN